MSPTALKNPLFAKLYAAQTINLIGDAFTWVGLSLLAFELAGIDAGVVLATALTLRVAAFVLLSPIAGVIADYSDRKQLMLTTHLARMISVCWLPFVDHIWQLYTIVLLLSIFRAFFTPTYMATIPQVTDEAERSTAIALSSATNHLIGTLGPGLAGSVAALVGVRPIFFLDGLTFFIASLLLMQLPRTELRHPVRHAKAWGQILPSLDAGTRCLWLDPPLRYALMLQSVTALIGAEILVNTIGHVQGTLSLSAVEYGWVMAAFGAGATLASVGCGYLGNNAKKPLLMTLGTCGAAIALMPANIANLNSILLLWLIAGVGQTVVNVSNQMLIADRVSSEAQGRVYGAHFAWSHLWWAIAYPLAGWLSSHSPRHHFLYSSLISCIALLIVYVFSKPRSPASSGLWHEHHHAHTDNYHSHRHRRHSSTPAPHNHLHFHS